MRIDMMNGECASRRVGRRGKGRWILSTLLSLAWILVHGHSALAGQASAADTLRVNGTVTDQRDSPVAGAEVVLTVGKVSVRQTTKNDGSFTLTNVPDGDGML